MRPYLSRKDTWNNARPTQLRFTEDEEATVRRLVPGVLKCDASTAVAAVKRFLGFVSRHSHSPIPMTAIPTILKNLPIRWGKNGKAGEFVRLLRGLGWIDHSQHRYVPRGAKGRGEPRRYWIGANMLHHFGPPRIPCPDQQHPG